jgi:hypothetical protein
MINNRKPTFIECLGYSAIFIIYGLKICAIAFKVIAQIKL